jgi:hypothetical protein
MIVDMTEIASALLSLASVTITAVIPIVVPVVLRRLHVATDTDLAKRVAAAANAGAGIAYQYAAAQIKAGGLSRLDVHSAALATGVDYVNAHLPDTLRATGCSPEAVREMVAARLGLLLASDPSVTAGTPSPAALAIAPVPVTTVGETLPPGPRR